METEKLEKKIIQVIHWIGSTNSLIIHTTLFVIAFVLYFFGFKLDSILLVLTTIVSLEAIYLSIFIQMSVNLQSKKLHSVALDVEEIQENVEEIQEDVEEIQKDVEEINEDEEDDEEDDDLIRIQESMTKLIKEVASLKRQYSKNNKS